MHREHSDAALKVANDEFWKWRTRLEREIAGAGASEAPLRTEPMRRAILAYQAIDGGGAPPPDIIRVSLGEDQKGDVWLYLNGVRYRTTPPIADLLKLTEWRFKTAVAEPWLWESWAKHE